MKRSFLMLLAFGLFPINLLAWTNGELLLWMDNERGRSLQPIANKFESDLGLKVTIETPEKITDSFPIAAQAGKGPDLVIWAHDKVGEWADGGLISPVNVQKQFVEKFFAKSWQAVMHRDQLWGYPLALETATLIYNKALLDGPPPRELSQLASIDQAMKRNHPGVITILWDARSAYYTWAILASGGGFVFARNGSDYDLKNIGIATPGAVDALSEIIGLIRSGILPKVCPYSETEERMGQGKLAMMISGPWAWSNLTQKGINFGLGQIPGVEGKVGRPFVGVSVAYINRSSPNQDVAKEFIEHYLLTDEGLAAMDKAKPIGVPALISLYEKLAKDNPHLRQLKASVDIGQIMPNVPQMGRFFSSLGAALQLAADGRLSADAALRQAEANIRHE
ncbi:MAG: maltose/maltodextrin ABC transporter substrate-binding protein MalE [Verrucomicrobia bacterium]|nr:maltose/maltodextrin ABC transporter substrate-binding protein MalE [Verrucomicrobiota bacterium]